MKSWHILMGNSCFEGVRQSGVGITSLTWRRPSLEHQQCLRYVQSCPLPVDPSWWSTTSPPSLHRLTMAPPWAAQLTFWSWSWVALANVILARTVSVQVFKYSSIQMSSVLHLFFTGCPTSCCLGRDRPEGSVQECQCCVSVSALQNPVWFSDPVKPVINTFRLGF